MFEKNFYTFKGIADELNTSETTVRYWQDRFGVWIPSTGTEEERWYPKEAIEVLQFIMEMVKSGMSEKEIISRLREEYRLIAGKRGEVDPQPAREHSEPPFMENIQNILKDYLQILSETQKRIADARERSADAEEKKAAALERNAEAQWIIAEYIKNLKPDVSRIVTDDERENVGSGGFHTDSASRAAVVDSVEPAFQPQADIDDLLNASVETAAPETDDLSDLLNEPDAVDIDDNQQGIDLGNDEIDAILIEPASSSPSMEIDDLSDLIDVKTNTHEPAIDDLNDLLDSPSSTATGDIDDLFDLIDEKEPTGEPEMDDLNSLPDHPPQDAAQDLDDLSSLIDADAEETASEPELDDLSDLLGDDLKKSPAGITASAATSEKDHHPKAAVKKIPDDYKSKIIALIIQMKEKKGMSIEASTSYLNQKGYKTISGADQWHHGMIREIYNHINHVRGGAG